jgi:hypothetical protein
LPVQTFLFLDCEDNNNACYHHQSERNVGHPEIRSTELLSAFLLIVIDLNWSMLKVLLAAHFNNEDKQI